MRVLDLGCGEGPPLTHHRIGADDVVFGVDVDEKRIEKAKSKWPDRHYSVGNGEHLERFADNEFDLIICNVALPYMDIPTALSEIRRILKPNGKAWFSLHSLGFTVGELRRHFPRPVPTAYAMYVLGNGLFFHCTGKTARLGTRCESFQTKTGIVKALSRAGFENLRFSFPENRFIVEALKRNQA